MESGETSARCICHYLPGMQMLFRISFSRLLCSYLLEGSGKGHNLITWIFLAAREPRKLSALF